jgi:CheY-specific phosphatase CheX
MPESQSSVQNPSPEVIAALRAKFSMRPQPANIDQIAGLVKGRESASMDELNNIITGTQGVTQRLINMAYPRQAARLGATVQMATARLGVNRVIVVMIGDLLTQAAYETFETMASMPLEKDDPTAIAMPEHGFLTGSVKISGKTNGQVTLALSPHLSLIIAAQILGASMDEELAPDVINDAIGELVNIMAGNLQSRLADAGLPSEVSVPDVTFRTTLPKEAVPGGSSDLFFFRHGMHTITLHLTINPSAPAITAPTGRAPMTRGSDYRANRPK